MSKPFLDGCFPEQWLLAENDLRIFAQTPQPVPNGSGLIVPRASRETLFPHVHLHVIARFGDELLAGSGVRYQLEQPEDKRL